MDDDKIIESNEGENPLNEETTSNNGNMADTESDEEVFADAEMTDKDEADELRNDYVPTDRFDASAVKHLSGMYKNWFLDYASYVILERAVPHIDDGLKPVQRRILHSMKRMDDGRYNKVANIAGHTMQFHPHGDASSCDADGQMGQKDRSLTRKETGETSSLATVLQLPDTSNRVCLSLHWKPFSTPKPPNGSNLTMAETKNPLPYLPNFHCCWRKVRKA